MKKRLSISTLLLVVVELLGGGIFWAMANSPNCSKTVGKACSVCEHLHGHNQRLYLPLLYSIIGLAIISLAVYAAVWLRSRYQTGDKRLPPSRRLHGLLAMVAGLFGILFVTLNRQHFALWLVGAVTTIVVVLLYGYLSLKRMAATRPKRPAKAKKRTRK